MKLLASDSTAMKAVDPTIQIGAVAAAGHPFGGGEGFASVKEC